MIENFKSCLDFFKNESLAHTNQEIVGLWGLKNEKPVTKIVKNRSPDPQNYFAIDPLEMWLFQNDCEMLAIFHSHIYGDSQFSEWDKITAENCCLPFLVYSLCEDKFGFYEPAHCDVSSVNLTKVREVLK
jgi:proteasome lid subunit RPN8/RPN11